MMMKLFNNPAKFAEYLTKLVVKEEIALHEGLKKASKLIEKTAKSEIGHYQSDVGNFSEWPELAESTQDERERQGYTPNDPLLRTGELRDSISSKVEKLEAVIGSDSDIMVYQEFGTSRGIPARPVLGPAAFRNKDKIKAIMGSAAVAGLIGSEKIHPNLGYDFDV